MRRGSSQVVDTAQGEKKDEGVWQGFDWLKFTLALILLVGSLIWLLSLLNRPKVEPASPFDNVALAVLPNIIAVELGFVAWYVIFRRIDALRSGSDREKLAEIIADKARVVMVDEFESVRTRMGDIAAVADLGAVAHAQGIVGIAESWQSFVRFEGPMGEQLRVRFNTDASVTWYIVTLNPEGLAPWFQLIQTAVTARGINVKWLYQASDRLRADSDIGRFWDLHRRQHIPLGANGIKGLLDNHINTLFNWAKEASSYKTGATDEQRRHMGKWDLYESRVPLTYLAFLSVPRNDKDKDFPVSAPKGTYGFVHPYPVFTNDQIPRYGLYLEEGPILNSYYWSTVHLFTDAVARKYVQQTYSES